MEDAVATFSHSFATTPREALELRNSSSTTLSGSTSAQSPTTSRDGEFELRRVCAHSRRLRHASGRWCSGNDVDVGWFGQDG